MTVVPLTLQLALELVPNLSARDREEIARSCNSLEKWARGRAELGGYALTVRGEVQAIGGVTGDGTLWLAGREGWARYAKHVLRVFRVIRALYPSLHCRCYADNHAAQFFVERLGFQRGPVEHGIVHYGMTR